MTFAPRLVRSVEGSELVSITLGHPLVDEYLEFVGARGAAGAHATLPRGVSPAEAGALLDALRTRRDRAMVLAMLPGGLRRCEVLSLRLADVSVGERRLHVCGKGGRERIVPVSGRFFAALGEYLELERPGGAARGAGFVP